MLLKNPEYLNSPNRVESISKLIKRKHAIRSFYIECYDRYKAFLEKCPQSGLVVEIGSGAGFTKELIPEVITSDVIPYPHLDHILDATRLPFKNESVRAFLLLNTFHHISDVESFLSEAQRCLKPDGRLFIIDQHVGYLSRWILKYAHHEHFDACTKSWKFETDGPLSGANGALAWIVFKRDFDKFQKLFPRMELIRYEPHSPLFYWLAGGLKPWSLIPKKLISFFSKVDHLLTRTCQNLGSFVDVEIKKTKETK